jgi:hypothetical protein
LGFGGLVPCVAMTDKPIICVGCSDMQPFSYSR